MPVKIEVMIENIHALISHFLQQQKTISLANADQLAASERHTKAGVVPFMRTQPHQFHFMKPGSKITGLTEATFQICKGTRMHFVPGTGWRDIRDSKNKMELKETLVQTALREGIEELGLKLGNIVKLIELGTYHFSSATTGKDKEMWLYAAEMVNQSNFLPDSEIASSTAAREWMTAAQFTSAGREDHRYILKDITSKLYEIYKE